MFRASLRPLSGVPKTVTATSGIGHNIGAAASFQRGLIRPRWKEAVAPLLWPMPEVAVTVFGAPDDGIQVLIRPRWKEAAAPIL
jgi:hypothetical protein